MKKNIIMLIALLLFNIHTISYGAENVTNRGSLWGEGIFSSKIHRDGLGMYLRYATLYNFSLQSKTNGSLIDDENDGAYLQDIYFGPRWITNFIPKLDFITGPQYRALFWYVDESKDRTWFVVHSLYWPTEISYDFGKLKFTYILTLWNTLEDHTRNLNNEFYLQNLFGITVPVHPMIDLILDEEFYILATADAKDGQKPFYRNAIGAGLLVKPAKNLSIRCRYLNYYTFEYSTSGSERIMVDHFINIGLIYNADFTVKKEITAEKTETTPEKAEEKKPDDKK